MRDYLVLAFIFISLPYCFIKPWIGILVWSFVGYVNPHKYCWGIATHFPVAYMVGLATLTGFFLTKEKDKFPLEREIILIVILWIIFTFTSFFAFYPQDAWRQYQKVSKIFLMTLITIPLFIDQKKLRYLLLVIAFSFGILGLKGGIFSLLTGGHYRVYGPAGSFIADNNDFALAMNMALPIIFYLAKTEENKKIKKFLWITFFFSIVSILFTYSRGGFLALSAVLFFIILRSQHRILAVFILIIGMLIGSQFIPEKWVHRVKTIKTYKQDPSAIGRINAWYFAFNLAKTRPFTGGGFETFKPSLFAIYAPNPYDYHDAHSIYFEILGEHGFIAFGFFIFLLASSFLSCHKLQIIFNSIGKKKLASYASAIQVSFVAYIIGGAFLGRAYFDFFYQLVAITVILKTLAKKYEEKDTNVDSRTTIWRLGGSSI